jgi:hypothetical protein
MRIEVPEKVFEALRSFRMRKGSLALLEPMGVVSDFLANNQTEEADWILSHEEVVKAGAIRGFVKEGEALPLDKPLESEDTGEVL